MEPRRCCKPLSRAVAPLVLTFAIGIVSSVRAQIPDELVSYPDWIFTNGKILTVDKNFSIVEALAVRNGRILAGGAAARLSCGRARPGDESSLGRFFGRRPDRKSTRLNSSH